MILPTDFRETILSFIDELEEEREALMPKKIPIAKKKFEFGIKHLGNEVEPCLKDSDGRIVSMAGKRRFYSYTNSGEYWDYLTFVENHPKNANLLNAQDVFWPSSSEWK